MLREPNNVLKTASEKEEDITDSSPDILVNIASAPTIFFRKVISPYWGYDCSHYPSCSQYSLLAIEKHGAIIGLIMTFGRLEHEANEAKYSPLIKINRRTYVFDPVENNDFWWHEE